MNEGLLTTEKTKLLTHLYYEYGYGSNMQMQCFHTVYSLIVDIGI